MNSPVLVLGGTGMIGSAVVGAFVVKGIPVKATTRHSALVPERLAGVFETFDALEDDPSALVAGYGEGDVVVNCLGMIKQVIDDGSVSDRHDAIRVNAALPHALADVAIRQGFHLIHVTTDCVYSGGTGTYVETDAHDASDVYGLTKSLGEVPHASVTNLRCSVIGRELRGFHSLLEWVIDRPDHAHMTGYTDHLWNGVTAPVLGDVIVGMVAAGHLPPGPVHLVPADAVTKAQLCSLILEAHGRTDVTVDPKETGHPVNRILGNATGTVNARLWNDAGYAHPPSIAAMVTQLPHANSLNGEPR